MTEALRVLLWNIDTCRGGVDLISQQIREKAPDIVLLNEIWKKMRLIFFPMNPGK